MPRTCNRQPVNPNFVWTCRHCPNLVNTDKPTWRRHYESVHAIKWGCLRSDNTCKYSVAIWKLYVGHFKWARCGNVHKASPERLLLFSKVDGKCGLWGQGRAWLWDLEVWVEVLDEEGNFIITKGGTEEEGETKEMNFTHGISPAEGHVDACSGNNVDTSEVHQVPAISVDQDQKIGNILDAGADVCSVVPLVQETTAHSLEPMRINSFKDIVDEEEGGVSLNEYFVEPYPPSAQLTTPKTLSTTPSAILGQIKPARDEGASVSHASPAAQLVDESVDQITKSASLQLDIRKQVPRLEYIFLYADLSDWCQPGGRKNATSIGYYKKQLDIDLAAEFDDIIKEIDRCLGRRHSV